MEEFRLEDLSPKLRICISKQHRFGSDSFLLADFSVRPRVKLACDLCSGCGIIPLLWLRAGMPLEKAYGVELQRDAVDLMRYTAAESGIEEVFIPVESDLKELAGKIPAASMELVTCNPPYFEAGHGVPSPKGHRLTARHEVACSIEDVCAAAARLLKFGGSFCVCHRPDRLVDVLEAMRRCGLEPKRLRFVHQRPWEAPWLVLAEGRRGGRPFLKVEPPLIVEGPDGSFSEEMKRIYRIESGKSQPE